MLKGDRKYTDGTDISYFMYETAERGGIVVFDFASGTGLGAAMDQAGASVKLADVSGGSGEAPAGLLLNDVVNVQLYRTHLNQHKDESQVGQKATVLRQGWVVTDQVGTGTYQAGQDAYFTVGGTLINNSHGAYVDGSSPKVGQFLSGVDTNGFVKVEINIT